MATRANIGQLIVSIVAKTNQFESGMKRAQKSLGGFENKVKGSTGTLSGMGKALGALGIVAGVAAMAREFNRAAGELDKLAKTSAKLGILPEKLAALQFTGEQTGVSVDTMNMALQRMTRRVAEAAKGTGEAKDALKELGLDATALNKLSPDQTFRAVAGAMQGVGQQSDKVRLAMKLFDSEGVALVNTLALGEKGLKKLEEQAQSLGIALSAKELAKVEEYNDAMNRLSKLLGGFKNKIVIDIAPAATAAINELTIAAQGFKQGSGFGKPKESFLRDQFRWTLGASDWVNKNVIQPQTDRFIKRDMRRGINMEQAAPDAAKLFGVRGLALNRAAQPGFNPNDVQRAFDAANIIEKNKREAEERRRNNNPMRRGSRALEEFATKQLPDAWRSLRNSGKAAEHWLKTQDRIFRSPSQETLDKRARMRAFFEERRELAKRRDQPEMDFSGQGPNSALLKGTVEAWQAVRQNLVPKQQLDEAKRHTNLLTDIRDRVGQNVIVEAGL